MKHKYTFLFSLLLVGLLLFPLTHAAAQSGSELVVEWANPSTGEVVVDALRNAIAADSLRPADRIYKLKKGGFYWLTEELTNKGWPLRIVGEEPDANDPYGNPAMLQMVARADGSVNGRMITGGGDITLKNLYITGCDNSGVQTYYQPIQIDANNSRFVFDNIILERTNFALIAFTGKNNDIFFTNSKFRNLIGQPSTQQWEGRGISIWADQDTVIVENCTFFNLGFCAFQLEGGAANYVRFNHNTLVNLGRSINAGNWWREAYFANNLILNGFWHGEGRNDLSNTSRDPRATSSGLFGIGALPSKYGPEQGRRILFANTATWRDPAFTKLYGDSIAKQYFVNPVTAQDFLDVYDNMVAKDTLWLSTMPDIKTYPADLLDSMKQNILDLRGNNLPAAPYFWKLPEDPVVPGEVCHVCPSWPLPENFSYTTASLLTAGTDGLPLGDLNWFPSKKATFEANKAQYIDDLKKLAGPVKVYRVVETAEAEAGTVSGTAAVSTFKGFAYFQMDGGGFIEWVFTLPTAGQYDLNCWTNLRGNGMRGERIFVNGVSIHDPKGWGEYIWDTGAGVHAGMPANEWTWTLITQANILEAGALTLKAGENKIRLEASWGWQHFAGWDVIDFATRNVVKQLRAADVTSYDIVQPKGEGAAWTPNGFKSVDLGANGAVAWTMNAPNAGKYTVQIFYQNYKGATTAQILADGTAATTVSLDSKSDSTGLSILSSSFPLTTGAHEIKLSGGNVKIDYIQLVEESIITSVKDRNALVDGFELAQNYPNPFNPVTNIRFTLGATSRVNLTVYNVLGQKVATLIHDRVMSQGVHNFEFNASTLGSGIYFYSLEAGEYTLQKRMVLLK